MKGRHYFIVLQIFLLSVNRRELEFSYPFPHSTCRSTCHVTSGKFHSAATRGRAWKLQLFYNNNFDLAGPKPHSENYCTRETPNLSVRKHSNIFTARFFNERKMKTTPLSIHLECNVPLAVNSYNKYYLTVKMNT